MVLEIDSAISTVEALLASGMPCLVSREMHPHACWLHLAEALDWPYVDTSTMDPIDRFLVDDSAGSSFMKLLSPTSRARDKSFECQILRDEPDGWAAFGVFCYQSGSGSNATSFARTVALFRSPHLALPQFAMTHEHLLHRAASLFGWQDFDFAADPEFSQRFLLKGAEEQAVREWFDDDCRQFFLDRSQLGEPERYLGLGSHAEEDRLAVFCETLQGGSFQLTQQRAANPVCERGEIVEFAKSALEIYQIALEKSK